MMLAGTGNPVLLVALLPQPDRATVVVTMIRKGIANCTEPNLPIYPPRSVASNGASTVCFGKFPV